MVTTPAAAIGAQTPYACPAKMSGEGAPNATRSLRLGRRTASLARTRDPPSAGGIVASTSHLLLRRGSWEVVRQHPPPRLSTPLRKTTFVAERQSIATVDTSCRPLEHIVPIRRLSCAVRQEITLEARQIDCPRTCLVGARGSIPRRLNRPPGRAGRACMLQSEGSRIAAVARAAHSTPVTVVQRLRRYPPTVLAGRRRSGSAASVAGSADVWLL
jgi:hypothetical protein